MRNSCVLLLLLFVIHVCLYQESHALTGNVCSYQEIQYRTAYKQQFARVTKYARSRGRWWSRRQYSYRSGVYKQVPYPASYSVTKYKCCDGWRTKAGTQVCSEAICTPPCTNNGTCIAPNQCQCMVQHEGLRCENEKCEYHTPCYPGGCTSARKCICPRGFTGTNCERLLSPTQDPSLTFCELDITDAKGKMHTIKECLGIHQNNTVLYTNLKSMRSYEAHIKGEYKPGAAQKPPYLTAVNLGVVNVTMNAVVIQRSQTTGNLNRTSVPGTHRPNPCGTTFPITEVDCTFEYASNLAILLEHKAVLEITGRISNGGNRTVYNANHNTSITSNYTGVNATFKVLLTVDVEAPTHCSVRAGSKCNGTGVHIYPSPTLEEPHLHTVNMSGWEDDPSGLHSWNINITDSDGHEIEQASFPLKKNYGFSNITFVAGTNMTFTLDIEILDVAGNVRSVVRTLSFPPDVPLTMKSVSQAGNIVGTTAIAVVVALLIVLLIVGLLSARGLCRITFIDKLLGRKYDDTVCFKDLMAKDLGRVIKPGFVEDLQPMVDESKKARFADFYSASLRGATSLTQVVLKRLKQKKVPGDEEGMEERARTLVKVADHLNIVKYYGVMQLAGDRGISLVLGHCDEGPLNKWLERQRRQDVTVDTLTTLNNLTCGIADGMATLHASGVAHYKLTSRNVLLTSGPLTPKLIGFGHLPEGGFKELPKRWMAPEVLSKREFSPKGDVWSYAMVLTEIFSLGDQPWSECRRAEDAEPLIIKGIMVDKPEYCDDQMYENVILPATKVDPDARPSFPDLLDVLGPLCDYVFATEESNIYYAHDPDTIAEEDETEIYYELNSKI